MNFDFWDKAVTFFFLGLLVWAMLLLMVLGTHEAYLQLFSKTC